MDWNWKINRYLVLLATCLFILYGPVLAVDQESGDNQETIFNREKWRGITKGVDYTEIGEIEEFDRKKWKDVTKDLDYSDGEQQVRREPGRSPSGISIPSGFGTVVKVFLIGMVIAILVALLLKIFGKGGNFSLKKTGKSNYNVLENLEEEIHYTDLEKLLHQAIQEKKYRLAIRIYYLLIIKELSLKDWINWKKDKTNYEYLIEVRRRPIYKDFSNITGIFERIWYGDVEPDENLFNSISPRFKNLFNNIKKTA